MEDKEDKEESTTLPARDFALQFLFHFQGSFLQDFCSHLCAPWINDGCESDTATQARLVLQMLVRALSFFMISTKLHKRRNFFDQCDFVDTFAHFRKHKQLKQNGLYSCCLKRNQTNGPRGVSVCPGASLRPHSTQ